MAIEDLPDYSLVLIEEIENGLHPVATARMVEYLIEVAERKKIQSIFTTHSNDALLPLPPEGIWAAIGNKVSQGKLNIDSLRAITGQIDAKLAIFTEDEFAKDWILAMIRSYGNIAVDGIEIHAVGGDGTAKKINKYHNDDPSHRFPSVCFIDGDSKQVESSDELVYRLPGETPESYVFNKVMEKKEELAGKLTVGFHLPYEQHSDVLKKLEKIQRTYREPHLLFSLIGEQLGLISENIIRGAFVSIWSQAYPDEARLTIEKINGLLPKLASEL